MLVMLGERRHTTFGGRKQRKEFDRSLRMLQELGLPPWAMDFYRRTARMVGQLPHEILCRTGMTAASHVLQNPEIAVFPTRYDAAPDPQVNGAQGRRPAVPKKRSTPKRSTPQAAS